METIYPLAELQERYLTHHAALGHSRNTTLRYEATFRLFDRFLSETGTTTDSRALATGVMQDFAVWLRDTPVRPQRGTTIRTEAGAHAALRDLRAFIRWLATEGLVERVVKIPMPKLPERLFPILSDAVLQRVWQSRYLTGKSGLAVRNRAMLGLMLDTGLRRAEVASLTPRSLDSESGLLCCRSRSRCR